VNDLVINFHKLLFSEETPSNGDLQVLPRKFLTLILEKYAELDKPFVIEETKDALN